MKKLNTNGFDDSQVQFANFKGTSCRIAYYSVIETTNIALQKLHGSCIEKKIVAHFHIYCREDTRMPKTLSSLQKWLMISLCTSFIHNFYTFWNTHKIKQWWSYFNTIKVVLILECNFVS